MCLYGKLGWIEGLGEQCALRAKMEAKMSKRSLRSDSGVTLLEISFAMGVLVIAISMMMGSLLSMQRSAKTVKSRSTATAALRSVTEQLRGRTFNSVIETDMSNSTIDGIPFSIAIELEDKSGNLVSVPDDSLDVEDFPNPIQMKVTATWVVDGVYDDNGGLLSGRVMSMSTRALIEGSGSITIPGQEEEEAGGEPEVEPIPVV